MMAMTSAEAEKENMMTFFHRQKLCLGLMALGALLVTGCGSQPAGQDTSIGVLTREDGSGTRSAFVELFEIEQKNEDGTRTDQTTPQAAVTNSTSVMLTSVSSDPNAIGYVSLGSLNDTVQTVRIDGADPTAENVENGSYAISRPFNLVVQDDLSAAATDFLAFIMSDQGQQTVADQGYIPLSQPGTYTKSDVQGKVTVSGSSSVSPLMEKLAEAYAKVQPAVSVEVQQSDSSTGISDAAAGISDLGMASRDLKDSEKQKGLHTEVIASDGIAVIVHPDNPVSELSSKTVRDIYTGDITDWTAVTDGE